MLVNTLDPTTISTTVLGSNPINIEFTAEVLNEHTIIIIQSV